MNLQSALLASACMMLVSTGTGAPEPAHSAAAQTNTRSNPASNAPFRDASWIGPSDQTKKINTYDAFRKSFELSAKPVSATVRITADSRYILWVNGTLVGRGPARGFPWAQPYDEFDLEPFLKPGTNWIACVVHCFGRDIGVSTATGKAALLLDGIVRLPTGQAVPIQSDGTWEMRNADWFLSQQQVRPYGYGIFSFQEWFDARREPHGWRIGSEGDGWKSAQVVAAAGEGPWSGFEPRGLKSLSERLVQPKLVTVGTGSCAAGFIETESLENTWNAEIWTPLKPTIVPDAEGWVTVSSAAGGFVALTFDLGWNPAAFARIELQGATGGEIFDSGYGGMWQQESSPQVGILETQHHGSSWRKLKKDGGPQVWPGAFDRFVAAAGTSFWESFLTRGYRLHTVKVRSPHPVKLRVLARVTHHDVGPTLAFSCSDPNLNKVWEVTDRTLLTGMLDAFVDNNWREQTQWIGDGGLGGLGAWATYGDTSLWRRLHRQAGQSSRQYTDGGINTSIVCGASYQFQWLPMSDGTLNWVSNLNQYHAITADDALIRELIPCLRGIMLRFVDSGFTSEHLFVQPPNATLFLDWVDRPWDKHPYNLTLNLLALQALRSTANLAIVGGDSELRDYCQLRDRELTEAVTRRFWSEEHKGWRENIEPSAEAKQWITAHKAGRTDDPWQQITLKAAINKASTACTRHGNSLAVLLKLGTPQQQASAADLVVRSFNPKELSINNGMSTSWTANIFGALFEGGCERDAVLLLQKSYGAWAASGAVHWGEGFGPDNYVAQTCGSSVNWLLSSYVLGIRPTKPGFTEAVFDPHPGDLQWAKGEVPTPHGVIKVEWKRGVDGRLVGQAIPPGGVTIISKVTR